MSESTSPADYTQWKSRFDSDGYLILSDWLSDHDLSQMRAEIERLKALDIESVYQAEEGCTVYGFHDAGAPSGSAYFDALVRSEKFLELAKVLLEDEHLYVYNSKMNCKNALIGGQMHWHQDYGYWYRDGVPEPNLLTFLLLPEQVDAHDGALYVIPGSHKLGAVEHKRVSVGQHKQIAVNAESMREAYDLGNKPVPLTGPAGTVAVFHANTIHGSTNNMGIRDRWQVYFSYNVCSNAPVIRKHSRPDFVVARNTEAL